MRIFKAIFLSVMILSLAGCSKQKFNSYRHITTIMTLQTQAQYEVDKDYILSHTSPDLQQAVDASLHGTIYDPNYSIKEKNVYVQETEDTAKLIIEYDLITSEGSFTRVVYCNYSGDLLTSYIILQVEKNMF